MIAKLLILSIFASSTVLANKELGSGSELNNTLSSESDIVTPTVSTVQENNA